MHRQRRQQVQTLFRFRELGEKRASISLQSAVRDVDAATRALQEATQRMEAVTEWKVAVNGGVRMSLYEQALVLEAVAFDEAGKAFGKQEHAIAVQEAAADEHHAARRAAKAAEQRRRRLEHAHAIAEERRISDEMADMWIARRTYADA